MKYIINENERPLYLQIYKKLRDDIIGLLYPYNSKLPSKRLLAEELGVSSLTIEHSYALLTEEGYIEPRQRSGYYVIFRQADGFTLANAQEEKASGNVINKSEYPDFSVNILSKTMRKVLSDHKDYILKTSPNAGCVELRLAIKQYLRRNRNIVVDIEQIIIGSGAEFLYGLIINLLGKDKIYAIESPSYDKLEQIYSTFDVVYELLPLKKDGIDSSALLDTKADVLHTTPYRSFPTGITASASKRHEYIHWSNKNDRFIIESDYGSEFSVSSQPMETLFSLSGFDNVIYLNTFSKTISPSMRIGYMVLPKNLVTEFQNKLGFYSCSVPTFEQLVICELLNSGDFERHINRVRRNKRKEINNKNT